MANYTIIGGDGRYYGPVAAEELRKWIAENRLNARSLVQREGAAEWRPLGEFGEFADAFSGPAAPPPVAQPLDAERWSKRVLERPAELRLGECLSSGFAFLGSNLGFVIGSVMLVWLLKLVISFVPFIGGILHLLFAGVLTGGLYFACLRRMRGDAAEVGSIFDGFKLCFVQLMLVGTISSILTGLGMFLCLLPGVYLLVAWQFALPLAVDKRLEFWSAMELSRKVATRVWFPLFVLLLLVYLPSLVAQILASVKVLGYLLTTLREVDFDMVRWLDAMPRHLGNLMRLGILWGLVGQAALLLSQFFAVGALMRAYENLFGERKS